MSADVSKVQVAIIAEAPIAGVAKKRFSMALGVNGAAILQQRLIERAIKVAKQADIGPVTVWSTPDLRDAMFKEFARRYGVTVQPLPDGAGLARLAVALAVSGPAVAITADCPTLDASALRAAADAVLNHANAIIGPSEGDGCVLFAARNIDPEVFAVIDHHSEASAGCLRACLSHHHVQTSELPPRWSVERPSDLRRLASSNFSALVEGLRGEVPSMMATRGFS
ncbi:2-phospho-L-lactate guanylyltransferase [Variibacter gotjawalensis]|uniref:2-phospho-L-lactate guanylyltransferase n=1 Tax=Variibacter gotjawalensis TaxID=1333996 RepID=A0A0S3PZC3_9BRAD|nr:DUF2064 domain-containing protein [Variibacter gotjawalensis]NIK47127.1 hypothetical protein [Variibacter gotjawalensis]RZS49029.1 hypothetical protein EV661_1453 [Variibacter gotjawalensis]BAT61289.1 2-phospho-L-lactate guanylyltransferase [Variibacter gotjawalensis]